MFDDTPLLPLAFAMSALRPGAALRAAHYAAAACALPPLVYAVIFTITDFND